MGLYLNSVAEMLGYGIDTSRNDIPALTDFVDNVGQGLENFWYSATGQTEKTSAYQAMMEREDSAYQRMAQDMSKAGLSKYFGGTPSSTGSYGDGLPKGLQYAAALLDMKSAEAGIRKTNSEANLTDAQAEGQRNENRTFDETHASQIANFVSQTRLNNARSQIAETEGQFTAEKVTAELDQMAKKSAQIVSQTLYSQTQDSYLRGELLWQDAEHQSQISQRDSNVQLNQSNVQHLREATRKISYEIAESIARANYLSEQSKKVVADTAYQILNTRIMASDWEYSIYHQIRYKDQANNFLGLNLDSLSHHLGIIGKAIKKFPEAFTSSGLFNVFKESYSDLIDYLKGFF